MNWKTSIIVYLMVLLSFVILTVAETALIIFLQGYYVSIPEGTSMSPQIESGDIVILERTKDFREGDVIHLEMDCSDEQLIHVAYETTENGVFTTGYNTSATDQYSKCDYGIVYRQNPPNELATPDDNVYGVVDKVYRTPNVFRNLVTRVL